MCARVTITGTQDGEWMGMPPSGRPIEIEALDMVRLRDGLAVEHWGLVDNMTMLEQLGAGPQQAPA